MGVTEHQIRLRMPYQRLTLRSLGRNFLSGRSQAQGRSFCLAWHASMPGVCVPACLDMHTCIHLIVLLKRQGDKDGSWGISLLDSLGFY